MTATTRPTNLNYLKRDQVRIRCYEGKVVQALVDSAVLINQDRLAHQPYQTGPRYGQWLADCRKTFSNLK